MLSATAENKQQTTQQRSAANSTAATGISLSAVSVLQQKEPEGSNALELSSANTIQMKPQRVIVTGLTHLVGISGNSLFRSPNEKEVASGSKHVVDIDDPFWSRRGPNQEIPENRQTDAMGDTKYAWYPLFSDNSSDYSKEGWYHLRDETFDKVNESEIEPSSDRGDFGRRTRANMIELSDAGYKLTIPYAKFQSDALRIFNYIKSKGLTGQLAGKRILIIKASGTAEAICHHWSFGGLNSDFNLKIDEIHKRLAGKLKFKSDADNDLPDDFRETILGWSEINPEGLNPEGVSANVRVYAGNEHSSRFMNGQYFHKFHTNEFIFAVEGADINAAYSGYEEIQVKVHPASGLGESSYFIYEAE